MKVILSRKGFDSSNGGMPSPILSDGTLLSLPIPYEKGLRFSEIKFKEKSYFEIIKQLKTNNNITEETFCHLDPDIYPNILKRPDKWRGLFGQSGAAQSHLINKKVSEGDIFLFFGWFKETENNSFKKKAEDKHVIFGYLQIGKIYDVSGKEKPPATIQYHPHFKYSELEKGRNFIYEAADKLSFNDNFPGYGTFLYNENLVLTKKGKSRSKWDLPDCFKKVEISYHSKKSFKDDYFDSAKIGQEFVIADNEQIEEWAKDIILTNYKNKR